MPHSVFDELVDITFRETVHDDHGFALVSDVEDFDLHSGAVAAGEGGRKFTLPTR